jgi:hypothetical protein
MSHTDEALGLSLPSQDASAAVAVGASPFDYKVPGTGAVILSSPPMLLMSNGDMTGI